MTVTNEQLVATLSANIRKFEKSMDRASGKANKTFTKIEKRGKTLQRRLSAINPKFARFLGPAAVLATARSFQIFADSATRIVNTLKVAGLEGAELERVYDSLKQSAQDNFAPFETLADLYSKAAQAQSELNVTSKELLNFTDKVALALRINGRSAAESRGALIQLSQAMGSGIVRAEEFNAILEGARPIAQAAAAGLEEAGGSVAKLRTLVIEGKISSEVFFRAFEAGAYTMKSKVAGAVLTTGQAWEQLKTKLIDAGRRANDATGFTKLLARELGELGGIVDNVGEAFDRLSGKLGKFENRSTSYLQNSREEILKTLALTEKLERDGVAFLSLGGPSRKESIADLKNQLAEIDKEFGKGIEIKITTSFDGEGATIEGRDALKKALEEQKNKLKISLGDYDAPTSSTKKKTPSEKFSTDIARLQARTLAIQAETAAQAKLNPLIDDYGYAVTKAGAVQDLLNEAKKAGLEITPQLRESINGLAEGYANATVEANQLTESQDRLVDTAEDLKGLGKSVLGGFIDDLRNGVSAADAFKNALNRIADKLVDMAIQNLFLNALGGGGSISSPSANAAFASGNGGLFAKGGYTGNASTNAPAGVVHGQEFVVNAAATKKNRALLEAMNSGKMLSQASVSSVSTGQSGGTMQNSKIELVLSPDLQVRILNEAANQSVQISKEKVQEAAPDIVKASVDGSGSAIASGKFKAPMAQYNLTRKTKAR